MRLRVRRATPPVDATVEALQARLDGLSRERQELRGSTASERELERNRREIVTAQWELSRALVRRHRPAV